MKKKAILRGFRAVAKLDVGVHAAHACYFLILSIFPALVLVLSLLRYTGLQAQVLTEFLEGFVPHALMGYVRRLIFNTYENSSGAILSLSAVTALWSASRGVYGILTGFNAIYEVPENRGYLRTRVVSLVYTVLFIAVLLKSLAEKVRDEGKEYITIYYGEDVKEKHAQKAADLFADICPDADVNLLSGGQPVYYYLISAE